MNERHGWIMVAVGVGICLCAWLALAAVAHLFTIDIGERLFGL